jgi:hypothetical protein
MRSGGIRTNAIAVQARLCSDSSAARCGPRMEALWALTGLHGNGWRQLWGLLRTAGGDLWPEATRISDDVCAWWCS